MSADAQNLVRRTNFAHLATIRANGSPKLDPVWIDLVDPSTVIMATGEDSLKTQNVLRDSRAAMLCGSPSPSTCTKTYLYQDLPFEHTPPQE